MPDFIISHSNLSFQASALSAPAKKWVLDRSRVGSWSFDEKDWHIDVNSQQETAVFFEVAKSAKRNLDQYPCVDEWMDILDVGPVTQEKIEYAFQSDCASPSLLEILNALIYKRDPKVKTLAFRVIRDPRWKKHWFRTLEWLRAFHDKEVLDLFMELAIQQENERQDISRLVDDYLQKNKDHYS